MANGYTGWNPNLWLTNFDGFCVWLGKIVGPSIYAMLMDMRTQEGALPTTMVPIHYQAADGKKPA